MQLPSLKTILIRAIFVIVALLATALVWSLPYENKPHISKLLFCLSGAVLISRGSLAAEPLTRQLLEIYAERPYDNTPIGIREASALISRLLRAFLIVGIGVILLNIAFSGRGM